MKFSIGDLIELQTHGHSEAILGLITDNRWVDDQQNWKYSVYWFAVQQKSWVDEEEIGYVKGGKYGIPA